MTAYQLIYDRFDNKMKDYELDTIFQASVSNYEAVLLRYLKTARTNFIQFKRDGKRLSNYIDDTLGQFTTDLDENEQEILAMLMVSSWLDKEINNITDLRGSLSDGDFKRISERNLLATKLDAKNDLMKKVNSKINEYTWYTTYMDD